MGPSGAVEIGRGNTLDPATLRADARHYVRMAEAVNENDSRPLREIAAVIEAQADHLERTGRLIDLPYPAVAGAAR